jgi:hypothetical protein
MLGTLVEIRDTVRQIAERLGVEAG